MHPDAAARSVEMARTGAVHHLRVRLTRVRTPRAEECSPHPGTAMVEGVVMAVIRSAPGGQGFVVGDSLRCEVGPCVPAGHPELMPSSPSIAAETLESASVVEVFLDADLADEHAALEVVEALPSAR